MLTWRGVAGLPRPVADHPDAQVELTGHDPDRIELGRLHDDDAQLLMELTDQRGRGRLSRSRRDHREGPRRRGTRLALTIGDIAGPDQRRDQPARRRRGAHPLPRAAGTRSRRPWAARAQRTASRHGRVGGAVPSSGVGWPALALDVGHEQRGRRPVRCGPGRRRRGRRCWSTRGRTGHPGIRRRRPPPPSSCSRRLERPGRFSPRARSRDGAVPWSQMATVRGDEEDGRAGGREHPGRFEIPDVVADHDAAATIGPTVKGTARRPAWITVR